MPHKMHTTSNIECTSSQKCSIVSFFIKRKLKTKMGLAEVPNDEIQKRDPGNDNKNTLKHVLLLYTILKNVKTM